MQLTERELAALEMLRLGKASLDQSYLLADAMLRLFPVRTYGDLVIRWDDPVTPERLQACGFRHNDFCLSYCGLSLYPLEHRWWSNGTLVPVGFEPRNMFEVLQLMERCGIDSAPKETT